MKKIAIIDDNLSIRSAIAEMIKFNFPDQFVFREAGGIVEGYKLLTSEDLDIVLLDVEMGDGTGLELIEALGAFNFKLVFVTGYRDYAVEAIKHRAKDYILKPINPLELIKTMNILLNELEQERETRNEKILIRQQEATYVLDCENVIRMAADGPYTQLVLTDGRKFLSSKNLKHYEDFLQGRNFMRVHHSHLVNMDQVEQFSRHLNDGIVMVNGDRVPVSTRRKKEILDYLEHLG